MLEAFLIALLACVFAIILYYGLLFAIQPLLQSEFGLFIGIKLLGAYEWMILALFLSASVMVGLIPGYRAYRYSLSDGMAIRL